MFGPFGYAACKFRSLKSVSTRDVGLREQLTRMCEVGFAGVRSLGMGNSVEDAEAVALVESDTSVLDCHFLVPLSSKCAPKTKRSNYASTFMRLHQLQRKFGRDEKTIIMYG